MPKLRVAVDVRDLNIAKTGVRTYLEEHIRAFKRLESDQLQFVLLDSYFKPYTGRNKFLKLVEHLQFFLWKQLFLPIRAFFAGCNVIFCADFFVPYFPIGAKTVPVLHDAFFFEYPAHYNAIWLKIFHFLAIPAARKSAAIITPTQYTAQRIQHFTKIPLNKIVVTYEGPKTMPESSRTDKEILTDLYGTPYILHVGVIEKRKNLLNLIKAYQKIKQNLPDLKLALVGQFSTKEYMDDRHAILDYIKEHALTNDVLLPGYVPDEEIAAWYRNAAVYVFPSYNEGFGIPILEAFAQNLPIVIANNSCLPEVAGDAACTFSPDNVEEMATQITKVLNDEALRAELVRRGKERAKLFSWDASAKLAVEVFQRVTSKR